MVSMYQMTQILKVFLWFLLFFTGFEVLGHMAGGLLVPEKYKWSFYRSMCCYIVFFIVVTCLLRLPNSKLEPAARFLLESNLFSLVLLVGLILWGVVASVLMVISNRWTAHLLDSCHEKDEYVNCLKPLINGRGQILAEAALPSAGALYTETVVTCVLYCGSARHGCCHRARLAQEWI